MDDIQLPTAAAKVAAGARAAGGSAERAAATAATRTADAARALTGRAGLSMRDAAAVLGISHQRVAQVLEGK